ncbi:hypothetical protein CK203_052957 [Vitis vinifera]|uniref:Uncharacterized protein n=1 Tax=Vitis vinifera TaxID=29760 RepID=A0A438GT53_VITVI|nr:hypothetical protein CK203_052957 [Vitis vinifera]
MDAVLHIFKRSICPGTHFSNHSLRSLLRRWTTYSGVRANTRCSKMTCEQPPSKSWLPDDSCPIGVSADSCPASAPWMRE